jgi:hypothetical protein
VSAPVGTGIVVAVVPDVLAASAAPTGPPRLDTASAAAPVPNDASRARRVSECI